MFTVVYVLASLLLGSVGSKLLDLLFSDDKVAGAITTLIWWAIIIIAPYLYIYK